MRRPEKEAQVQMIKEKLDGTSGDPADYRG